MSLQIELQNNTSASALYAYVTSTADGVFLLGSNGLTVYQPSSPSSTLSALAQDCSILVGGPGAKRTVTIPYMAGSRIWFSKEKPLTFYVNPGPALVEPSVTNPSDPNYDIEWDFCELTFNSSQLYVNISYVDFACLPISIQVESNSGTVSTVGGLPSDGLDTIAAKLTAQGGGWEQLVVTTSSGSVLRALSANSATVVYPSLFSGYYQPYVDQVWAKYANEDLVVDTQGEWGSVVGRIADGKLGFPAVGSFEEPSAADIFSGDTGPFSPAGASAEMLNIGARLDAAFNRSTLLIDSNQPEGEKVSTYYQDSITNYYAKFCHEVSVNGEGYAFAYDDVGPSGGSDQSGFLADSGPKLLTVSVGQPL